MRVMEAWRGGESREVSRDHSRRSLRRRTDRTGYRSVCHDSGLPGLLKLEREPTGDGNSTFMNLGGREIPMSTVWSLIVVDGNPPLEVSLKRLDVCDITQIQRLVTVGDERRNIGAVSMWRDKSIPRLCDRGDMGRSTHRRIHRPGEDLAGEGIDDEIDEGLHVVGGAKDGNIGMPQLIWPCGTNTLGMILPARRNGRRGKTQTTDVFVEGRERETDSTSVITRVLCRERTFTTALPEDNRETRACLTSRTAQNTACARLS